MHKENGTIEMTHYRTHGTRHCLAITCGTLLLLLVKDIVGINSVNSVLCL